VMLVFPPLLSSSLLLLLLLSVSASSFCLSINLMAFTSRTRSGSSNLLTRHSHHCKPSLQTLHCPQQPAAALRNTGNCPRAPQILDENDS
jgi:hypothetical protein